MKTLNPIARVIDAFKSLPGVGPRMAERFAYYIIKSPREFVKNFSESLINMKETVHYCSICRNFTDDELCGICSNPARQKGNICVVEDVQDMLAVEKADYFSGLYHILHGSLSPLEGIGPGDLTINDLMERVRKSDIQEVIIATNPTVEGEATATYIFQLLKPFNVKITRIAQGVPRGSDLEYADSLTLKKAFEGRKEM